MCAFKFHTILVKDKYEMTAICFLNNCNFVHFACNNWFCYLTLHGNNGHQSEFKLYWNEK